MTVLESRRKLSMLLYTANPDSWRLTGIHRFFAAGYAIPDFNDADADVYITVLINLFFWRFKMAWIQTRWSLKVTDPDEGDPGESAAKDEPSLQFAFVTHFGSEVRVHGYTTGNLYPTNHGLGAGDPRRPDKVGIVSSKNVPTSRNPFFGLVVRAVEQDRSLDRDRDDDNERFYAAVDQLAQTVFDSGGVPLAEQLMFAGESAELSDRIFRNDDDRIGVGAMVFPSYGAETIPLIPADETSLPNGSRISGTTRAFGFTFRTGTARYIVGCNVRLVTNDPDAPRLIGDRTIDT